MQDPHPWAIIGPSAGPLPPRAPGTLDRSWLFERISSLGRALLTDGTIVEAPQRIHLLRPADVPSDLLWAFDAVRAARNDDAGEIDRFSSRALGLRQGPKWREAVSTALLSRWEVRVMNAPVDISLLAELRTEAKAIHRQLTPLWKRKVRGSRLRLLDALMSHETSMTLYDVLAGSPARDLLNGAVPDDPRIASVLSCLDPVEHAVALAWAEQPTGSWAEAAVDVISMDPVRFAGLDPAALGERVRRKLKRLGTQRAIRNSAGAIERREPPCR
ncbi:hypothetical protein ACFCZV_08750 [Streptomyces hydrogenans]|uniref:hypothetical protein n=1 Tax=Streptomyces hydrogenans TaxID=1873719 RepID=UPI0035D9D2E5